MTIYIQYPFEELTVDDQNRFARPYKGMGPSNDWLLTGAVEYKFGRLHKRYSVEDIRAKRVPWFYKNGKQRCFITDRDHGTDRVQMSPRLIRVDLGAVL